MIRVYHPTLPGVVAVVTPAQLAEWLGQGWLKRPKKQAPPATE